ncbi:MAG: hypothetical protein PHS34_08565 [Candidatus Omnitrophica bacterium]|nr:hypothetical protein [Candidatus Omnitrophota bacterium]MDD5551298.1 hypothetical protein [Candidatus Omnitrophota bacterium]
MHKWIAAKLFGIQPSEKDPELCNKCEDSELVIDLIEVEKAKARQKNPHLKKYNSKLKELLKTEITSKDNFINWITGLSGGALLFIYAQDKQLIDIGELLFWAGITFLFAIMSAIFFKMLLRVSYGSLRLEVKLLRILLEGYEFRRAAIEENSKLGEVCKETEENLKRNNQESLEVLDPKHKGKTIKWSVIGYNALDIFYWLTIGLFFSGFVCMGIRFFTCSI